MYSLKEDGEWEGGGEEKLLLPEGNKNTDLGTFNVPGLGKVAELHQGPRDCFRTL